MEHLSISEVKKIAGNGFGNLVNMLNDVESIKACNKNLHKELVLQVEAYLEEIKELQQKKIKTKVLGQTIPASLSSSLNKGTIKAQLKFFLGKFHEVMNTLPDGEMRLLELNYLLDTYYMQAYLLPNAESMVQLKETTLWDFMEYILSHHPESNNLQRLWNIYKRMLAVPYEFSWEEEGHNFLNDYKLAARELFEKLHYYIQDPRAIYEDSQAKDRVYIQQYLPAHLQLDKEASELLGEYDRKMENLNISLDLFNSVMKD